MTKNGLSSWEVRGQLGRGGTARVDRVSRPDTSRDFALKRALPDQNDPTVNFADLARREYELIGGLRYSGLVRLVEHGSDPEAYLLMEICQGSSADELGRVDDIVSALNLFSAMAVVLEFLRLRGIYHGDIKPHNFFLPENRDVLRSGKLFYAKLSDFSLARLEHERDDQRLGSGTVGYMAPETIDSNKISHSSDLFALGVTGYQILTGVHPFMPNGERDPAVINSRVKEERPELVRILREDCPELAADLIQSLLAPDATNRPKSAWEVCEIVERAGATYPYRRALIPARVIDARDSYEDCLVRTLRLNTNQRKRLDLITGCDIACLRLVLYANFSRGFLKYDGARFAFDRDIYWPNRLRRDVLARWSRARLSEKKAIVSAAVSGTRIVLPVSAEDPTVSPSTAIQLSELVRAFLRPATIKRLSRKLAAVLDEGGQFEQASRLYLQAGDIDRAVSCASSIDWKSETDNAGRILTLLYQIIDYSSMVDRLFDARQLLMIRGDLQKSLGDANSAEKTYARLVALYEGRPSDELLAEAYKDLGDLYKMKQELTRGLEELEKALKIYRELNDELEVSHVLNNMGNLHFFGARFGEAVKHYTQALRIQRRLDAKTDIASTLSNLGSIYAIRGRFNRSVRILNLSLELKRSLGNSGEIARTLNNLGYLYHVMGSNQKGIECLTESLDLNRKTGNQKEVLFNLENLGTVMIAAGQLYRSIDYLKEGAEIALRLDDKPHMGVFALRLSTVSRRLGSYHDASRRLEEASELAEGIDDWFLRVSCALERAKLYHYVGMTEEACDLAVKACQEAAKISQKPLQLEARLLLIRTSSDEQHVKEAHAIADELHLSREHLLVDMNRAEFLLNQGRIDESKAIYDRCRDAFDGLREDLELPRMQTTVAALLLTTKNDSEAHRYAQEALTFAKASGMLPEQIEANIVMGQLAFAHGEYEKCYSAYREALQIAKKCSGNIDNAKNRTSYQQRPSIQFLAKEIRRLSELLGQKTKGR